MDSFVAYIVLSIGAVILFGLFALGRAIVLWYLRVNEAIDTLKSIESLLRERLPVQQYPTHNGVPMPQEKVTRRVTP